MMIFEFCQIQSKLKHKHNINISKSCGVDSLTANSFKSLFELLGILGSSLSLFNPPILHMTYIRTPTSTKFNLTFLGNVRLRKSCIRGIHIGSLAKKSSSVLPHFTLQFTLVLISSFPCFRILPNHVIPGKRAVQTSFK